MAIALLAKLRSLHMAAIQYPYIVITLPRIIAISSHTYVSRTIRLEPALTYLSVYTSAEVAGLTLHCLLRQYFKLLFVRQGLFTGGQREASEASSPGTWNKAKVTWGMTHVFLACV